MNAQNQSNQDQSNPNQQQPNPNQQQQSNQNQQQQFNQNQQQQFIPNQQQQFNQQQFNQFMPNQMPMGNFMFNPMFNMGPMMTPEQQKIYMEVMKSQAKEMGQTLLKQKKLMEQINQNRAKREEQRKNGELVLFFNHNDDLISITVKANIMIPELIEKYAQTTQKNNFKMIFKGNELNINDARALYEIEGLVSGEEIIVQDKN